MKLSIIIVNWNTKELTLQTLRTLFAYPPSDTYEVILVDNASSDGSVAAIREAFPDVVMIENEENLGFGAANNSGMRQATGQYFFLLNSDTVITSPAIDQLVSYLDLHPEVTMVGPQLHNQDGSFQHACRRSLPQPASAFAHLFGLARLFPKNKAINRYKKQDQDPSVTEEVEAISGAAMMFRREVFEKIGGFDEQFFMYAEDLDLCKRVHDAGWKTVYVSTAHITHLGGGSSAKRKIPSLRAFYDTMWLYYRKHFRKTHPGWLRLLVFCGITMRKWTSLCIARIQQ